MRDGVFSHVAQILARLFQVRLDLVHFLAVAVDVKQRNPPDVDAQQHPDVLVRQVAAHLTAKRLEALPDRGRDGLAGARLLDY